MRAAIHVAFPFEVDRLGHTASVDVDRHVRNLIEQLLFTMPGERVNRPTFGTGLMQLVFEPNSHEIATAVEFLVQGSLQQFLGDLITVETVQVSSAESAIEVVVEYRVRRTDERRTDRFSRAV